ncbi:potassium channel subfamily K member 18 isoform X1 [Osmerus mordax]|uniref:potassium channel subfamily K member 18 isoform X1 n=1 Tax=Osmerus mordax TaxID=8014 RepID=UPI00350EF50E
MSLAKNNRYSEERSKCVARIWKVFPHVFLIVSLIAYAALGAILFNYVEGNSAPTGEEDYDKFLCDIVRLNRSDNSSCTREEVKTVKMKIKEDFKSIWLQHPTRWTFFGSLFFCCTVFTTVGYGEIFPVTLAGKMVCILYAMLGIPLMLLVISDVGDILAVLLYKGYLRLHRLCKLLYRTWSPRRAQGKSGDISMQDGTYIFNQEMVVHEPMDIRHVLHSQADVKRKSIQLRNNTEIFKRIITRDKLSRKGALMRSMSCPELNRMSPVPKGFVIWDFTGIGESMEHLDVPLVLILIVVFTYILFGGLILPRWETQIGQFDAFYFCFITLTTIGFGDIVPNHPKYFMLTSFFLIVGMAIMSMAFKLSQLRVISCYRRCMHCITGGNVESNEEEESE